MLGYTEVLIPCAYLRAFQPIEAFSTDERARWERYIVEEGHVNRAPTVYRQRAARDPRFGLLVPDVEDHADILKLDEGYLVCPWHTRLRILTVLPEVRESFPDEVADSFLSEAEARRAAKEAVSVRRRTGAVPFMMQSPWHVPIPWFALFDDEDRRLTETDSGYRLSYLTTVRLGLRRAKRAIPNLRHAELHPVAEIMNELVQWLSAFASGSMLELDYGGLSNLLTWDEMDDDHSARDIQEALVALSEDRFPRSAELYQGVLGRWAEVRSHESLN